MTTVVVQRRPRRPAPELPTGQLPVPPPPEVPPLVGSRWGLAITALPMLAGTVATALLFAGRQGGAYSYVVGGVFGLSTLGMLATSFGSYGALPKRAELIAARRAYLRHLASLRRRVRVTADQQRAALHYRHPPPDELWSTVDSYRLWERRPADADFAVARVGVGPQTLATTLIPPATRPLDELDPMTAGALRRFLATYAVVPALPVAVALRGFSRVYLHGPDARAVVRSMLAQLSVFHAPDELLIAVCAAPEHRPAWDYLKWLPHALHPTLVDALGPVRLVAAGAVELEQRLADVLANRPRYGADPDPVTPHVVLVCDDGDLSGSQHINTEAGVQGLTVIDLSGPPPRVPDRGTIALTLAEDGTLHSRSVDDNGEVGTADRLDLVPAEALARQLAALRPAGAGAGDAPLHADTGLAELLGLADPAQLLVEQAWAPRANRDRLRLPIGVGTDGQPVELDLKESAQNGMGPHGLLVGATGSGKSELLRTLILGLAATHDSETLNFVLVDYKGGATFGSLDRLPHTAAVITNLQPEVGLADRIAEALSGEVTRRQELLRRAGNFVSVRDYAKARAGGAPLAPLPDLLIVCDEFSELITVKPDFIDLFVQIGRLGRSLGMHLLLASQRLEEGRLRGLETHLSYRLCLRTFSALESRAVLGRPDAYELPRAPGHGYLKYGTEPLIRFRSAYVSGPYQRPELSTVDSLPAGGPRVREYTTRSVTPPEYVAPARPVSIVDTDQTLLDVLVDRLAGAGAPAHQVWLPPLGEPATLDELLGPPVTDPARGLTVGNLELRGALQVPVAVVDKPFEQRRDLLWLALDGSAGHLAVVGGPRSGKSTLLRTVLCGLSLTHTPAEVQFYLLDFGGGGLAGLRDLPHVGGVAGRADDAAVRRTVGEVAGRLATREQRFARENIESLDSYRRRGYPGDPHGDVFLVVDGWPTLRGEYADLEPVLTDIATRGLSYGVHVLASAPRWTDFRPAIRDLFGSRLELRLGDPTDSLVSRRTAANVPAGAPGRGITADGLHFLAAQPTSATAGDPVAGVAAAWPGRPAPPVRLLPTSVPYPPKELGDDGGLRLPIGLAESDLGPVFLDFASEPHFLLFGDAESGKSSFLRALARSISTRFTPEQARLIIVDYRRSLLGAVDSAHLIGYGTAASPTAELIESAASYLQRRVPGPDVAPEQLRDRSWWTGPELFVLVDDYDLVAAGPTNPLRALLDHLAQARDTGLHLVLVRRSGGAARSLYEPLIQRLRELSSPGLVLAGDRDEGPLLGTVRPQPLPPGRGWLVTRRDGARLIQLAWCRPAEST